MPGLDDTPIFNQDDPTNQGGAPVAGTPPEGTPPAGTPPQDDPINDPRVQLAIERAKRETLEEVVRNGGTQRQDAATSAQQTIPQVQLPNDPIDLLNAAQKQQMEQLAQVDPVAYGKEYARLAAQLERARIEQQAAPLVASQASTFVELFKGRMARNDAKFAAQIEPIFDGMLSGLDLRPLVQMTPQARDNELLLRWNAAKAQVLEKNIQNAPPPRAEPLLNSSGAGLSTPGGPKKGKVEEDSFLGRMNDAYKFTPEQLAALEEVM